jgi:hypothetical protein
MGCWDGKDDDGHHKPNNFQKSKNYMEKYERRLLCLKLSNKKQNGMSKLGKMDDKCSKQSSKNQNIDKNSLRSSSRTLIDTKLLLG